MDSHRGSASLPRQRRPYSAMPLFRRFLCALLSGMSVLAQSLSPAVDPICGLPGFRLTGQIPDAVYELRASDDLGAPGVWETLMRIAPPPQGQLWFDPDTPARGHRFYRVQPAPEGPQLPLENFALIDQHGVRHELFREGDASIFVLVFTDNAHLAEAWAAVKPLQQAHAARGVRLWLVNPVDTRESLVATCTALGVETPVLHDRAQLVTRTFGGHAALQAVALDKSSSAIFYRGPIQDSCTVNGRTVDQAYLNDALARFTQGDPVVVQEMRTRTPELSLPALGTPEYARDIAPILQSRCVSCHRPGDIGSWSMTNHAAVAAQATVIRRSVLGGHMPPWHADPAFGKFANDASLTPAETAQLIAWIDAGTPPGTAPDPLVTNPPPPAEHWPLGTPDLILRIPSQSLPANGEIPYRYLLVKNPVPTNVWLRAATVRPGNREVVHHSLVFSASNAADFLQVMGGLGGFFAGYVPGSDPVEFPAGTGKLLKAGSYLVFQMHYTPNGKATTDRTEIGLYFAAQAPDRELVTTAAFDTEFSIPPGVRDHEVVAETVVTQNSLLYEMSPHMHYRGARMRFEALYPDGTAETLINIPGYEFAWQTLFRLAEPKHVPAGTRIRITGGFDNSADNPWNPDPLKTVLFGEQTSDEMLIGYLNLATE